MLRIQLFITLAVLNPAIAFTQGIDPFVFSDSVFVNTDGNTEEDLAASIRDEQHEIATDGKGTTIVTWTRRFSNLGTDREIYYARSVTQGRQWTKPRLLYSNPGLSDDAPHVETDGDGVWIIAFSSQVSNASDYRAALYCRSTDDGRTFSAPNELNVLPPSGFNSDASATPKLATDRRGIWMAVWSNDGREVDEGYGTDEEILYSVSTDNGLSFDIPDFITTDLFLNREEINPDVTTDRAGNWVVVWERGGDSDPGTGTDKDIYFAVSSDNGGSWSNVAPVNSDAITDNGPSLAQDQFPQVETDLRRQWIVTWQRNNGDSQDSEHGYATSVDPVGGWSAIQFLQPDDDASLIDSLVSMAASPFGSFIASWSHAVDPFPNTERAIAVAISRDGGSTWSSRALIPDTVIVGGISAIAGRAKPAFDLNGDAIVTWSATDPDDNTSPFDTDLKASQAVFSGSLEGRVTLQGIGLSCGFVFASSTSPAFEVAVATDANGFYAIPGLPAGEYDVRYGGPGLAEKRRTPTITAGQTRRLNIDLIRTNGVTTISGVVTDIDNGLPLAGAKVTARIASSVVAETYTCATGLYEISDFLKGGTQVDLEFEQPGYDDLEESVNVMPGDDLTQDAPMQKNIGFPSTLAGFVNASTNKQMAIPGARVEVFGFTNVTTFAEGTGAYAFDALPEGQYDVRATAEGYNSDTKQIVLPSSDPAFLDFSLEPGEPADVNGDFMTNAVDVQLIINAVLGLEVGAIVADVNGDGNINSIDIQLVINAVLGL